MPRLVSQVAQHQLEPHHGCFGSCLLLLSLFQGGLQLQGIALGLDNLALQACRLLLLGFESCLHLGQVCAQALDRCALLCLQLLGLGPRFFCSTHAAKSETPPRPAVLSLVQMGIAKESTVLLTRGTQGDRVQRQMSRFQQLRSSCPSPLAEPCQLQGSLHAKVCSAHS